MDCETENIALCISAVSLALTLVATFFAKSTLAQAKQVAAHDRGVWRQQKWFDLFFIANEAYDSLDRFQVEYKDVQPNQESVLRPAKFESDWNCLMALFRKVHSTALVFPVNAAINALLSSTNFKDQQQALSKDRLNAVLSAVEGIRGEAFIGQEVLGAANPWERA